MSCVCFDLEMIQKMIEKNAGNKIMSDPEMGCTTSATQAPDVAGTALHLPNVKLKFTLRQLRNLNTKLSKLANDERPEPLSEDMEITAERLVQRIVSGAAQKDPRFKSKYIIVLHKHRMIKSHSHSLEYLVMLDSLHGKCGVAEGPPGCARLRPNDAELWEEFLTSNGYLRRDKIIERWVELLAWAAGGGAAKGNCGAPGLIIPPGIYHILRDLPQEEQCYYGDADHYSGRAVSQEHRVAIVEGTPWVRVRLAGGRLGALGIEAKLSLAVPYSGWPSGADFPSRTPLGHPDALLFYKAAQTGFFIVGGAPGSGVQWSERCAGWQVWAVGARALMGSRGDGALRVATTAEAVLHHLRERGKPPLRAVSRFMVEEILLWRLERPTARGAAGDLKAWSSTHLAHQVLCIFDNLLGQVVSKSGRHYLFPGCDVMKLSVWRGARIAERDWRGDANAITEFLRRLHTESYGCGEDENDIDWGRRYRLENVLIGRWSQLLQESAPAGSTRGGRLSGSGAAPYSPRQLAYLATVARNLLTSRQLVIQDSNEWFQGGLSSTIIQPLDPIEDLIHILAIILDQARDYYLRSHLPLDLFDDLSKDSGRDASKLKINHSKDTLKRHKLKNCYDASAAYLIDSVRRDSETHKEDLTDDCILVRTLLKWLYRAVDDDKKYLSPVLRPYLELLFVTSHENCWHLEEFNTRCSDKEFSALTSFCKLVSEKHIGPAEGFVEAASKGWQWAENMLEMLDVVSEVGTVLRLIFLTADGLNINFDLSLPADSRERDKWNTFLASKKDRLTTKLKMAEQCVEEAFMCSLDNEELGFESLVHTSKSEEILSSGKMENFSSNGDASSKTHTLRSTTDTIETRVSADKYHTLRSVSSKYSTLRNSESLFGRCWSAGDTLRLKHESSRPTVLEESNQNQVIDSSIRDDEIETSLHCCLRDTSPMTLVLELRQTLAPHREYRGIIKALINMQRYTILQELAGWVAGREERTGALRALHRLARGGRRASGPLPRAPPSAHRNHYSISPKKSNIQHKVRASIRQYYRQRNIDALSGDESNSKNNENPESQNVSPRTREEQLDLEIQREYLQNPFLHEIKGGDLLLTDHYINLCREAIKNSNTKEYNATFNEFNRNRLESKIKNKDKRHRNRSSSEGRSARKEAKNKSAASVDRYGMAQTLGRYSAKELKISSDSLLGTCREARLHHAARKSVLPDSGQYGGPFGDAFKISPVYCGVQSDYNTMTQSILQGATTPIGRDRQRLLTASHDRLH